jgi:hypothetical protein
MQSVSLLALFLVVGGAASCGSGGSGSAAKLCHACSSDGDCLGNPCFADQTGGHFCGAPCESCPAGYACQPVQGTSGPVVQSCFPTGNVCTAPAGADLSASSGDGGDSSDLAGADFTVPNCTTPASGGVTTSGGTVDRLFFGYTGDTRPSSNSSSYPAGLQTTIDTIYTQMGAKGVQFALDGGDHMEASNHSDAVGNMASYQTAAAKLGKPLFMTMGNHECATSFSNDCGYSGAASSDVKMSAYMSALSTISGQSQPYYRVDIMTGSGKAVFLVVADDAWNATQQAWLTAQLTDADANAKYTFVSKHHPDGNTDQAVFQQIYDLVTSHKYTLFMTGHSHEYKHPFSNPRAVVMGLGGAPFDNPSQMWNGYLTVMQCPDDHIYVTAYDIATGNVMASFNVPPQ